MFPWIFPETPLYLLTPSAEIGLHLLKLSTNKRHNELKSEWQNIDCISSYDVLISSIVEQFIDSVYTNSHVIIRIKDFFMEFSEPSSGKYEKFVNEFLYDNVSTKAKSEDLVALLYTA